MPGVDELIEGGWEAQYWDYLETERLILDDSSGVRLRPSPETDRDPSWAARNYFTQQGCEDRRISLLLDDDVEMQAEAIAAGRGGARDDPQRAGRGRRPGDDSRLGGRDGRRGARRSSERTRTSSSRGFAGRKGRILDIRLEGGRRSSPSRSRG